MDYITKLSKETDPSIYKYRLLNLINNWGRITLFTGKSMRDTYINFETAILAKKNGFDWPCFYYATYKRKFPTTLEYDSDKPSLANWNDTTGMNFYDRVSLPTQALLQRWLREKHQVDIVIIPTPNNHYTFKLIDIGVEDIERPPYNEVEAGDFNTYEACLEAALQKCFIFIK